MRIAIIGAGNMGGAIACGLASSDLACASDICCTARTQKTLDKIKAANAAINVSTDNKKAANGADIVILAVKPRLVEAIINEIKPALNYKKTILVSIAAGISFRELAGFLKEGGLEPPALFRVIPNTAIAVKESVNFISPFNASQEQTDTVKGLFDALGLSVIVEERLMDAGTALASCGIAYAFRYIRAAVEGGVELGLHPEQAKLIELQTLKGAVALLEANGSHPEAEIDKVTTPGGITIKGLNAMEKAGFTNAVIQGLKASV